MKLLRAIVAAFTLFSVADMSAAPLPPKEKLHLYLLIGQSNMAGRGFLEPVDQTPHPRVIFFDTNNLWCPAVEPITKDPKKTHGVGPGLAFGKAMANHDSNVVIGLVPCAIGGTPLSRWEKGGDLYKAAVQRMRLAMYDGTLKGILWHQGEQDASHPPLVNTYAARLTKMVHDLREDLAATDVPFVAGEIGQFFKPKDGTAKVNEALRNISRTVPLSGCASSDGLTDKGDSVHFDSKSQREFGQRYAEIMVRLQTVRAKP